MSNFPNYRILWIDPGRVTGWATYSAYKVYNEFTDEAWACGYLGPEKHHSQLEFLVESQEVQDYTVGVEDFINTGNPAAELISVEYIGVAECVIQRWKNFGGRTTTLQRQQSSQAKGFITDSKLAALGLLNTPASKKPNTDMNDACRHLVYYMVDKCGRMDIVNKWKD